MNNKKIFVELLALQKQALKSNDLKTLNTVNKAIFDIRESESKQKATQKELERDNRTARKIEKLCEREQ